MIRTLLALWRIRHRIPGTYTSARVKRLTLHKDGLGCTVTLTLRRRGSPVAMPPALTRRVEEAGDA